MTLLCGTDFSEHARVAMRAAVSLAKRSRQDVLLVHVSAFLGWQAGLAKESGLPAGSYGAKFGSALAEVKRDLERRLDEETKAFAGSGVKIRAEFLEGTPDEVLVACADKRRAELIVIGALGRRSARTWTLGGTADRVAQRSKSPVLVVRRAEAFESWVEGRSPLRVLVGIEDSESCDGALEGLSRFLSASPCEIVGAHVYWPPAQRAKSGSRRAIGSADPEIEAGLRSGLEPRLARSFRGAKIELRLIGGLGRAADHLVQAASELESDLIVVGNHQRKGLDKFWHGSVSHGVIDRAATNVLCIPTPSRAEKPARKSP